MSRFKKLAVALGAVLVLLGTLAADGQITGEEWGQLLAAAVGAFGVYQVPKEFFGKAVAGLIGLAGVFGAALADGSIATDEWGQLVVGLLVVLGVGAVRNDPAPADRV